MHWNYGMIFKKIRMSKGLRQSEITGGNLSPTTLSRLENGKLVPSVDTFQYLLEQLGISYDEFEYISNNYFPNEKQAIINDFFKLISNSSKNELLKLRQRCESYLKSRDDTFLDNIIIVLDSALSLQNDSYKKVDCLPKIMVSKIWRSLEKMDEWYLNEIRLLNAMLFFLPLETLKELVPRIIFNLEKYSDFKPIENLKISIFLNLSTLFLQNNDIDHSLKTITTAKNWAKQACRYDYYAVCLIREGICDKNIDTIDRGKQLLTLIEAIELKVMLEKEIELFFDT